MTVPRISVEELVVHTFYSLDGPAADEAYQRVRALWGACRPLLGEPIAGTELPIDLPAERTDLPAEALGEAAIAGQESAAGDCQAILRRRHDVLNLSVGFSAYVYDSTRTTWTQRRPLPGRDAPPGWLDFDRRWDELVDSAAGVGGAGGADSADAGQLGEARLYLGTVPVRVGVEATAPLGQAAGRLLPPARQEPDWWARGVTTAEGFAVWESSPLVDSRVLRRIVVLGAANRELALSAWVWSNGDPAAPPFARYLLHAAKLRHQVRVWNQGRDLKRLRGQVAGTVARQRVTANGRAADQAADAGQEAGREALQAVEIDVAAALRALSAMKRTVEIAADNMTRHLAGHVPDGTGLDLLGDDRELSRWFGEQLDDEIAYLAADRDLLREVGKIVPRPHSPRGGAVAPERVPPVAAATRGATIGILTAMPEEFHAMRMLLEQAEEISVPPDRARYVSGVLPSRDAARPHHVVLTKTGGTGLNAAADAATNLSRSFSSVDCLLVVGIAAGVPDVQVPQRHVRLGDIVVATWGIADYKHVIARDGREEPRQQFPRPSPLLHRAAEQLQTDELAGVRPWEQWLDASRSPYLAEYGRPPDNTDMLAAHPPGSRRPRHPPRTRSGHRAGWPKVHYGRVGSASVSLRDAQLRDQLAAEHNVRAFEMEAAGVGTSAFLNDRHWFMVRGVSDYADSGFDTTWRKYASLAAAAYVRALLGACQPIGTVSGTDS